MLLLHQVGSLKIGEVVRYTITYTPSQDRILPSPEKLHVRLRNTSAIALRAAFVHGPYTLSVATYPSHFTPNEKFENPKRYGVPEFEPMLKAGGSWECELVVPDNIRQSAGLGNHGGFGKGPDHDEESASWIIEVSSQVIFSTSAAVGYELLVARDPKSLNLSTSNPVIGGQSPVPQPGRVSDHQQSVGAKDGHHPAQQRGIFSRAVRLTVEDTATLWNTPRLPGWDDAGDKRVNDRSGADEPVESMVKTGDPETKEGEAPQNGKQEQKEKQEQKQKKIHLVVLTHGLHSNLGADMLFMKESIDAAVKQAKIDAKARRAKERAERGRSAKSAPREGDVGKEEEGVAAAADDDDGDDDEEVIVRGYSGNATKTERGIKYLGKRLARYILSMTYPDQPFLPSVKGAAESITHAVKGDKTDTERKPAHKHSTIQADRHQEQSDSHKRPYKITSISFIAHSLGGLVQTYAVAYIQKHSPQFFDVIKPINFIALASPFLGLSNENPLYVKFALDFGLVGRTGQDLGLTWRAPTIARSGWGAIVGNLGETAHKKVYGETQPESKPLLRILPTGPAHTALKKFRSRTVYSNVVNDGIVPLRTSCLLFLDWQGLGRVEKARRDAGLVETVVGFGWAELTGTKMGANRTKRLPSGEQQSESGSTTPLENKHENMREVPQPATSAMIEDDRASLRSAPDAYADEQRSDSDSRDGPLSGFFNFFRSNEPKDPPVSQKQKRIFRRGQTINFDELANGSQSPSPSDSTKQFKVTSGHELNEAEEDMAAPPRTTFFESAGDLLNPKVPDVEYLIDPSKRPRTIFHDRVYQPSDIPPPPLKKRASTLVRRMTGGSRSASMSQESTTSANSSPFIGPQQQESLLSSKDYDDGPNTHPDRPDQVVDSSSMRVEEKIARAYHRDLPWRKVLVKLEPDAHNNIIVRRMFSNAYGWPVVKHLVDSHFSDSAAARLRDEDEASTERALDIRQPPNKDGGETKSSAPTAANAIKKAEGNRARTDSEAREALDSLSDLRTPPRARDSDGNSNHTSRSSPAERQDSMTWSDRDWQDSEYESDMDLGSPARDDGLLKDKEKRNEQRRSVSPLSGGWNWAAEKIAGKGATSGGRTKSPSAERSIK